MNQYFENRTRVPVMGVNGTAQTMTLNKSVYEDSVFANERPDKLWNQRYLSIHNSTFAKMGFKESIFTLCDLAFCVFIDCYFRQTTFNQVKFTGCIFINCVFDKSAFLKCDFQYARFENCYIPFKEMENNLPRDKENICAEICRNLSTQCLQLGDIGNYRAYFFEMKKASERHHIRKLLHRSDSYYKKYNAIEQIEGLFLWLFSIGDRVVWGYGERLAAVVANMVVTIISFAVFYSYRIWHLNPSLTSKLEFWNSIYISACNFFMTNSNCCANLSVPQTAFLCESIIGMIFMGFFVAGLFRNIKKR